VCHFDEIFLQFKQHLIPVDGVYTQDDKLTSQNLLRLWTDFAKTGNPTPDPSATQWLRFVLKLHLSQTFANTSMGSVSKVREY
jgi:hypothetical protein